MNMSNLDFNAPRSVIVQPGVYFLCDPCYVVPDDEWSDLLDKSNMLTEVYAEADRGLIVAFSTMWGDGTYYDQYGNSYDVDAGVIGLVDVRYNPTEDMDPHSEYRKVVFSVATECSQKDGILIFGDTYINTKD